MGRLCLIGFGAQGEQTPTRFYRSAILCLASCRALMWAASAKKFKTILRFFLEDFRIRTLD
jgi:hypothetical protein